MQPVEMQDICFPPQQSGTEKISAAAAADCFNAEPAKSIREQPLIRIILVDR
jgi:hypothetical protein